MFYAQTLLDELRYRMMQAEDWLHDRTPETAVLSKFDKRGSPDLLAILKASYDGCELSANLKVLALLVGFYKTQVRALHGKFRLAWPAESDLAALAFLEPLG